VKTQFLPLLAALAVAPLSVAPVEIAPAEASAPEAEAPRAVVAVPASEAAPPAETVEAKAPERPALPANMRVILGKLVANERTLTVVRPGHLVALASGDKRAFGMHEAHLVVGMDAPVTWETADKSSLEVMRGDVVLAVEERGKARAELRPLEAPLPFTEESAGRHVCKAFEPESASFVVVCKVDSLVASAARVFGEVPLDRIQTVATDSRKFFRFEIAPGEEGVDAAVFGYSDGARGHVVRAEASVLPGEPRPMFALLSASRSQPIPIPRAFPHRHPPHILREPFEPFL